jgi:hypothetical protein
MDNSGGHLMLNLAALMLTKFSVLSVPFGAPCDPNTDNQPSNFFGFPHWWKYISKGSGDALGNCTPSVTFPGGLLPIGMAIIDILLYFAGIAAVVSIIYGGFGYMTAAGSTDKITSARKRIVNSLIGLVIVLIATGVVSFIGNSIG